MNIAKEIKFNTEKPYILSIKKTESSNIFAVGLVKDQVLVKHKTQLPTLLIVLQGGILFRINSAEIRLSVFDTYQIPVDTEHDVTGLGEENIFLILKEKV
jgi:quercetin dioxygenase-like cupin family protein